MSVSSGSNSASIQLFPFRQTRRSHEVVYAVNAAYTWPVKSEYTAADIATSGSTLVYTSNGTDLAPTFIYTPAVTGTFTFIAFTTDGNGQFSRVEEFSAQSVALVAVSGTQSGADGGTADAPLPRWSVTLLGGFLLLTVERQRRVA